MERLNSEGIPRDRLLLALRDRQTVLTACRVHSCMLCKRAKVNEAGLCDICYGSLEGEELKLAVKWLQGIGP